MFINDQQRLALRDRLLATYQPEFPEGMKLIGWDEDEKFMNLEFKVTHAISPGVVRAGVFAISHVALDDGEDAERGLKYLLDRARQGDLPPLPASRQAAVLLRCTTERGWEYFTP